MASGQVDRNFRIRIIIIMKGRAQVGEWPNVGVGRNTFVRCVFPNVMSCN